MLKIQKQVSTNLKPKPSSDGLGFGQYFSDHIFCAYFDAKRSWHSPEIIPYSDLKINPASSVLHYGQSLFEGMKAFKQKNGSVVLFRPDFNCRRLQQGADRLCMQAPPSDLMLEGIKELIRTDADWIPNQRGQSLYIRPTLIGTEGFLGVRPSNEYLFFVILSPVGAYYKEGLSPISIWVESQLVRAAPGGLGETKAGANYAASLKAALKAKQNGYAQVLWLDVTHQYIEEVGTMNVFFVFENEIVTPALDGTILGGGVRDSIIQILKERNLPIVERKLQMSEVVKAAENGHLKEAFGTGTAAVVSPIGELCHQNKKIIINNREIGSLSQSLYNEILDLQFGEIPDHRNWLVKV